MISLVNQKKQNIGLTKEQMFEAYKMAMDKGVKRFGLHTMVISNETRIEGLLLNARIVFELAAEITKELGIKFEFINLGGGIGIPYRPEENAVDLEALGEGVHKLYDEILLPAGLTKTAIAYESGSCNYWPLWIFSIYCITSKAYI